MTQSESVLSLPSPHPFGKGRAGGAIAIDSATRTREDAS
jgi:hypothetical protein